MDAHSLKVIKYLSLPLILLLAIEAYCGAFVSEIYQRETLSLASQSQLQDKLNLFILLPLLALSLWQMHRQKGLWMLIFGGVIFYSLYQAFLYAFGLHFNGLFIIYCLHLGLTFYLFVYFLRKVARLEIAFLFREDAPLNWIGGLLILAAIFFYSIWLSELIPALRNAAIPASVAQNNLLVNPRHVLDIAIVLPSMLVAGILLMRRHGMGYLVSAVFLIYLVLQSGLMMATEQASILGYFAGGLALLSGFAFWRLIRL